MTAPLDGSAEVLDRYFLDGAGTREEVVKRLLLLSDAPPAAAPFLEGMRMLRGRTPELSLLALRLVLAGKSATDEEVTRLRSVVERIRAGGEDASEARREYERLVR